MRRPFVFDMETSDPDDFLTLLLLLGHPAVDLRAVTVTPGTREQVGLVRWALERLGRDIPVGAFDLTHGKDCVSAWHYAAYGMPKAEGDAEEGWEVLRRTLGPGVTLVTGAPLKNLGRLLREGGDAPLGSLFIQGGFAGEGVVPSERQLHKFKGRATCPSFNLNGDPRSALDVLAHRGRFSDLRFVSKNVCHGVMYDDAFHIGAILAQAEACGHRHGDECSCECHHNEDVMHIMACCATCPCCGRQVSWPATPAVERHGRSLELIIQGMDHYLAKRPKGKALHDPLAACCAIDPGVGEWAEVEVYQERGEWGSRLAPGSGVRIITGYDRARFERVFLGRKG